MKSASVIFQLIRLNIITIKIEKVYEEVQDYQPSMYSIYCYAYKVHILLCKKLRITVCMVV